MAAHDRSTDLMVVNVVLWLDRPLERDAFLAILDKRMVDPFPRFRQHVVDRGAAPGGPA